MINWCKQKNISAMETLCDKTVSFPIVPPRVSVCIRVYASVSVSHRQ